MKGIKTIGSLVLSAVLVALAGCNKEALPGAAIDVRSPITFVATMEGQPVATRATVDNTWEGGEEVSVMIGNEVKKYTAAANGTLSVAVGETPWYWTSPTIENVRAWYPYRTAPLVTIRGDQSGDGYQASDFGYANQTSISYNNGSKLDFKHVPVKVTVNLKSGNGITADEVQNATVTIVSQPLQEEQALDAAWELFQAESGSREIKPKEYIPATSGYDKTARALLFPQKSDNAVPFIRINIGEKEFFYSAVLDMTQGNQYTYDITVSQNGITVKASGAHTWGAGATTKIDSEEPIQGFADKDLKIGDYYYDDGTWSDGGYRKYEDGSTVSLPVMPILTNPNTGNTRTVIGIVFWKDDSNPSKGKVVSVAEGQGEWSMEYEKTDATNESNGRVNMAAVARYIADNGKSWDHYPAFKWVAQLNGYRNGGWTDSDRWYLPAKEELKALYGGYFGDTPTNDHIKTAVNASLVQVNAASLSSWFYWSSSEDPNRSYDAWYVSFSLGYVSAGNKDRGSVRAVFAF